jgi:predicted lysophospholipase L1 biosynthesis ABC-type transport system permease subunit
MTYRVVGQIALPIIGGNAQPLADGAVFTLAGLARIGDPNGSYDGNFLVRVAPGQTARFERALAKLPAGPGGTLGNTVTRVQVPPEVARIRQIDWFPSVLAVLVGALSTLAVAHALITAVRRRRRDLAILKTLGFSRRQVSLSVASQATVLAAIGLAVGIPLGLLVGRELWRRTADSVGLATDPAIPVVALVVVAVAAVLVANVVAYLPGRAAARTRPAPVLRTE